MPCKPKSAIRKPHDLIRKPHNPQSANHWGLGLNKLGQTNDNRHSPMRINMNQRNKALPGSWEALTPSFEIYAKRRAKQRKYQKNCTFCRA